MAVTGHRLLASLAAIVSVASVVDARAVSWSSDVSPLERRAPSQAGGICGTDMNGTMCAEGLCCSARGTCGTGRAFCDAPVCQATYGPACDENLQPAQAGANTTSVPRPYLGSVPYGGGGITQCTTPNTLALTYDDGPFTYTGELLDILSENDVPATFFVTGVNLGKGIIDDESKPWPNLIRRMRDEGHQIASHTWSHPNLNEVSSEDRFGQMVRNEMAFRNVLGVWPTYMRPPMNTCYRDTGCVPDLEMLGYHIIKWNLDTLDYRHLTTDTIQQSKDIATNAFQSQTPYIVGMHDIHPLTVRNLTQAVIDAGRAAGYTYATVGGCLGDPEENWYRDAETGEAYA